MNDDAIRYFIAITLIKGLGKINAKKLIAVCGSAEAVFHENTAQLANLRLRQDIINQLKNKELLKKADQELNYANSKNITVISYHSKQFPIRLKQCEDAPIVLYTRGKTNLNPKKTLAIVGTRMATSYGREICNRLIHKLSHFDVQIVSGLATGIDTCAHEAALENRLETIAVLGHGLNRIYPYQNRQLAESITENGCLLSDFNSISTMVPGNFPSRNRIIAGLTDATIVIESDKKGGSLITADLANSYNRDVFAIPGRINDKYSSGCNKIIKEMKAAIIENADDLVRNLNWDIKDSAPRQIELFHNFNSTELKILETLSGTTGTRIDEISHRTEIPLSKISSVLLNLEFKNAIRSQPGKLYILNQ